jgi:PhnB protein
MELAPYIFFYGRCEEALEFYKKALGGSYELTRNDTTPMAEHVAPDFKNKVMHATFKGNGITFMASDGREARPVDPDAGNVSLSLGFENNAEAERVFKALSEGGNVVMPLEAAFWGGRFGMIHDKFGTEWMVVAP